LRARPRVRARLSLLYEARYREDLMLDPFEVLKALHALAAVDEVRAVDIRAFAKILGAPLEEVKEVLSTLSKMDYVSFSGERVYLTEIGVLKISSLFC